MSEVLTTYHTSSVTRHKIKNCLGVFIPVENISTITAADDILTVGAKKVDTFYGLLVAVEKIKQCKQLFFKKT